MIGREVAKLKVLTKGAEGGGNASLPQSVRAGSTK